MFKKIKNFKTKEYFQNISTSTNNKILTCFVLILIIAANWAKIGDLLEIVKDREAIIETIGNYGALGPVLLAFAIFLQVVIAAIPGHLLMFASGYLYGFTNGFMLTWITTVIASQVTFLIARKAGKPLVYRLVSKEAIDKWNKVADKQGIVFFIFSFSLPIFPVDIMSYVAGLTSLSARRYLVANLIGHLPVAILMSLAGAYGLELSIGSTIAIVLFGIVIFILWLRYQNNIEKKLVVTQGGA